MLKTPGFKIMHKKTYVSSRGCLSLELSMLAPKVRRSHLLRSSSQEAFFGQFRKAFCRSAKAAIASIWMVPSTALATPVSHADFIKLASQCALGFSSAILEVVARTESNLDPLILHDNTTGQIYNPGNLSAASTTADRWVSRSNSMDISLIKINSANFDALGMTAASALDPCVSLAGSAAVLQAAYGGGDTPVAQQAALLMALSRYNTGSPFRGIMNGYARTVMNNTRTVVSFNPNSEMSMTPTTDPNEPPAWNVSATGAYAQIHGASWLVSLVPSSARNSDSAASRSRWP